MRTSRTILELHDVPYVPVSNLVTFVESDRLPPSELTTSSFGLIFSDAGFLMANIESRGWDVPGGHIEADESPEAAVIREVREETGVDLVSVSLFGYQRIRLLEAVPDGYRYPVPDSYLIFFLGQPASVQGRISDPEVLEARFWALERARRMRWVQEHSALFEAALLHWNHITTDARHPDLGRRRV